MKIDNASKKSIANDVGSVHFPCPNSCGGEVVRSKNSRQIGAKWTCPSCGLVGP